MVIAINYAKFYQCQKKSAIHLIKKLTVNNLCKND